MTSQALAATAAIIAAGISIALLRELRALRQELLATAAAMEQVDEPLLARANSTGALIARKQQSIAQQQQAPAVMREAGIGRMKSVGSVLAVLPKQEHNDLVAALSRRAAPVSQWGPVLTAHAHVVEARLQSLQTGDLVLTSTRVGSWVGNTVQVLTDSTWNHVAVVVRGRVTDSCEEDPHDPKHDKVKRQYVPRSKWHFEVDDEGTAHLFEASWQGVHIYPNEMEQGTASRIHDRLLKDSAYEEYSTIAVRALQGVERTAEMCRRLEAWIVKARGTAFEANTPLHNIFSEDAGGLDSMHCAELTTETLKVLGLIPADFCSGTAPPCVYADAPFGGVSLLHGSYGPMEIIKSEDESEHKLANAAFTPKAKLRHQSSVIKE